MRRIFLIAALLLLPVASAMAAVTINATVSPGPPFQVGGVNHKTVTIGYSSDADVRAFALDINVGTGMNIGDSNLGGYKTGESIDPSIIPGKTKGYGIFPGRFRDFVNPSNPDPCYADGNYNPTTPWAAPGAENTGLGWPKIVVELGTLWAAGSGDINKPALSGTLFKFDVNSEALVDGTVSVALNTLRGGVVGADGTALTTNLPLTVNLNFPPLGCTVPTLVGSDRAVAIAAITTAGFTGGYKEWAVPGTGQPMRQVVAQLQTAGSVIDCATQIDFNDVNWPIKPMTAAGSLYVNWVNRGRPQCWAYPRQCRGDATGTKQLSYWIGSNDLNLYKSAQSKLESVLPPGGICADFTHSKQLSYWVGSNDLNLYKSFQSKLESLVPLCGNVPTPRYPSDPNYNYWCVPTGAVCPPGQYCGPVATCPNAP